ncbi:uncharacterized protein MYCFIDRAFT_182476 [Pseudocercospora fijiensis CIRAD86]|uniref:Dynein light chain n=1 Tax=Pseudocercospora fijiensis (strain CIRAD86) TaxID=383855 RepID=M3B6A9_PSEFD|nr:uncharacterized protein MYCFIDRAFT_182476 [Pseudocercospora fijiensis CIRAD86]EME84902.1 hypothetical protein MYCFIDRAFT_182476 [Pseudocercospora fijiensis CIRAD86]
MRGVSHPRQISHAKRDGKGRKHQADADADAAELSANLSEFHYAQSRLPVSASLPAAAAETRLIHHATTITTTSRPSPKSSTTHSITGTLSSNPKRSNGIQLCTRPARLLLLPPPLLLLLLLLPILHHHQHASLTIYFSNQPIPVQRLKQICNDACDAAISSASVYEHSQTQAWNNAIIGNILQQLISESDNTPPKHKFIVNTTIIQHLSDPRPSGENASEKKVGRRGMHSASGAFWNNEKDGMWSHKYEGGEGKGMDIVVSVMWVAV